MRTTMFSGVQKRSAPGLFMHSSTRSCTALAGEKQVQVLKLAEAFSDVVGVYWAQQGVRFRPVLNAAERIGGYLQSIEATMDFQHKTVVSSEELRFQFYSVLPSKAQ